MTIAHVQTDLYDVAGDGTQSFSITHPGGSDVLLVLNMCVNEAWSDTIDTEVYDSGSGTLLGANQIGSIAHRVTYWTNPPTGTNTMGWDISGGVNNTAVVAHVSWFTGVDQTTPIVGPDTVDELSEVGFNTPSHTALTAGADERIFAAIVSGDVTWPAAGTNNAVIGTRNHTAAASDIGGAVIWTTLDGYDTCEWGDTVNKNWASIAAVLNAADAGGGEPHIVYERRKNPLILL